MPMHRGFDPSEDIYICYDWLNNYTNKKIDHVHSFDIIRNLFQVYAPYATYVLHYEDRQWQSEELIRRVKVSSPYP